MIYRRVDDEFLDPVHFRADSMLGCPGPDQRRPRRQRHDRQRGRQRRRRRQARLHLPARPDPLLPRRGADPAQRRHLAARATPDALRGGARPPRRAGRQAGRRLRRQGHRDRPARHAAPSSTSCARSVLERPARLDRPAGRAAVDRPDARRRQAAARGTSTCARSRSTTATTSGCCPAA